MPKLLTLDKILEKKYVKVHGLSAEMEASLGEIEDAFDMLVFGDSGNGKTNFVLEVVAQLGSALSCGATYVSWEEGHGKSLADALRRHDLKERIGSRMDILDGGNYEEVRKLIAKRKSKKIWVFDSIQASGFTAEQFAALKKEYVMGKRRKIFIYISWSQGKKTRGSTAESVRYYANIKIWVEKFVAFISSRYGGNKNYIIWEEGALRKWGKKDFRKHKNS